MIKYKINILVSIFLSTFFCHFFFLSILVYFHHSFSSWGNFLSLVFFVLLNKILLMFYLFTFFMSFTVSPKHLVSILITYFGFHKCFETKFSLIAHLMPYHWRPSCYRSWQSPLHFHVITWPLIFLYCRMFNKLLNIMVAGNEKVWCPLRGIVWTDI